MKKCIAIAFAVCSAVYGAEDGEVYEDSSNYESSESAKDAYAGAYVAGGISFQHNDNDVKVSDDLVDVAVRFVEDGYRTQNKQLLASGRKMIRKEFPSRNNYRLNGKRSGKIGGSVGVGYGKFVKSNFYVGADLTLDISGENKSEETDKSKRGLITYGKTTVKNGGVVPTLAVKVGGYVPAVDSLVYARVGAALVNAKVKTVTKVNGKPFENEIKINKITPIIGLGFEKKVAKKVSIKFEGDYRFTVKGDKKATTKSFFEGYDCHVSEKAKVGGYSFRLMGVYHF